MLTSVALMLFHNMWSKLRTACVQFTTNWTAWSANDEKTMLVQKIKSWLLIVFQFGILIKILNVYNTLLLLFTSRYNLPINKWSWKRYSTVTVHVYNNNQWIIILINKFNIKLYNEWKNKSFYNFGARFTCVKCVYWNNINKIKK